MVRCGGTSVEKRASAIAVLRARLDEDDRPALEDVCHQLGVSQRGTLEELHDRCARKIHSHFATFNMPSPDDTGSESSSLEVTDDTREEEPAVLKAPPPPSPPGQPFQPFKGWTRQQGSPVLTPPPDPKPSPVPAPAPENVQAKLENAQADVAAAAVLLFDNTGDRLLRVATAKSLQKSEWMEPGGKREGCETPRQCAIRELRQETGLSLDGCKLLGDAYSPHCKAQVFVYQATEDMQPVAGDDVVRAEWVHRHDVYTGASFRLQRSLKVSAHLFPSMGRQLELIEAEPVDPCLPLTETVQAEPVSTHALSREILEEVVEAALDKVMQKHAAPAPAAGSASFGSAGVVKTFNDEFVPPLELPEKGTLLIDSDCGLGKSTQIVKACQKLRSENPRARIIAVSSRKSHAQDLAQDLAAGGLDPWCYLEQKEYYEHARTLCEYGGSYEYLSEASYVDHPCVVISLEHMTDLRKCGPCDLLILDEIRSLADKTKEQTTVQSMGCFDELARQYHGARYVISADADCRIDNAVKYLHGMDPARQVETWCIPFKRMKRTMQVSYKPGTKQHVPAQFLQAIRTLTSTGKIGVATSTRKMANKYADVCRREGIPYKVYHGKSDARTKYDDFKNPDAAWADYNVIIFNSCLTVGVDPKTTVFAKCFMHTSRFGASLRDLFQGICRLGRKEHLLLDTNIFAVVQGKDPEAHKLELQANPDKLKRYHEQEPTYDKVLKHVAAARRTSHENAHEEHEFVGIAGTTFKMSEDWFLRTRAACELESELDQRRHVDQFFKFIKHRGWTATLVTEEPEAVRIDNLIGTNKRELKLTKDQRNELKELPEFYAAIRSTDVNPDEFFTDECYGILDKHDEGKHLSTTEALMKDLYWALYNIRTFDLTEDQFTNLVKKQEHLGRFVAAHYMTEEYVRTQSAEALNFGAHPEMRNRKVSLSKGYQAAKTLTRALCIDSWTTTTSYVLPDEILQVLNDELKRGAFGSLAKLDDQKYVHSKNGHELNGMTFREIAEKKPLLDKMGLCEWILEFKPNHKLAGYLHMRSGGMTVPEVSLLETQLSEVVAMVTALLGIKPAGGIWKSLQSFYRLYGMKVVKEKREESGPNGRRIQGLFKSAKVVFEHADIMDRWLAQDQSQFIPVSQWPAHLAIVDYDLAENMFSAEYERPPDNTPVVGERVERVVKSALVSFEQEAKQNYEDLKDKHDLIDKLIEDAKNEWYYLKRMLKRGRDDPDSNDVLLLRTDYIIKYGIGRQVGTWPSLQSCCRKFRGALAKAFYHDIDVANCHFVLMLQVAKDHGVVLPTVAHYANPAHREEVLKEVMEFYECGRDSAKQLLLSILNGGGPQAWMHKAKIRQSIRNNINNGTLEHLEIVRSLQGEYQKIRDVMFAKYASQLDELINQIKQDRKFKEFERDDVKELIPMTDEDYKRKAFSTCLQNEENIVLTAMDEYFQKEGYNVDVLVYDGMMVRRRHGSHPVPPEMLRACEDYVCEKTRYPIRLEEKCLGCGSKLAACGCADKTVPQIEEMEPEPEPEG